jgi:WXG100 family type VII secretion target
MNELKVSTTRLNSDADQIYSLIQSMEKELKNMKNSVNQMNQMWEGVTKKAFVTAFESDQQAAADVIKELKSFQKYEVEAKNKYEQCEKQITELLKEIRV